MTDTQMMILELGGKGYTCSQILLIAALRMQGLENENLVRASSALAQGVANTGKICGALTGGLCLLSMYSAKGSDFEQADLNEALMWEELIEWFNAEICHGKENTCDAILGLENDNSTSRLSGNEQFCGQIVGKVWEKCLMILSSYGIDPSMEKQVD